MSSIATGSNAETVVEQVAAVLPNHTKYVHMTLQYTVALKVIIELGLEVVEVPEKSIHMTNIVNTIIFLLQFLTNVCFHIAYLSQFLTF